MTRRSVFLSVTLAAASQLAGGCGYHCCRPFLWRGCGGCFPQFYQPGPGPLTSAAAPAPVYASPVLDGGPGCSTCSSFAGPGPVIAGTGPTAPAPVFAGSPGIPPGMPVYTGAPITLPSPQGFKTTDAPNPMPPTGGMK